VPKYTFKCPGCQSTISAYTSSLTEIDCSCGLKMDKQLPTLSGKAQVTEVVDKMAGKSWKQDQKEILTERKADYFWSVEVPRFVDSGTYSLETMLENKWVYYDERGDLQTRNKPPEKS
jgi:ribosomal protein S27E